MAILEDPQGVIKYIRETETAWVLRNLHKSRQFRTNTETGGSTDQYREILRCVISRDISTITNINVIYHESIKAGRTISAIPKGGETTVEVTTGTGGDGQFSPWQMTDQRIDELNQDGSSMYRETREYISVSGDSTGVTPDPAPEMWEDFDYFA